MSEGEEERAPQGDKGLPIVPPNLYNRPTVPEINLKLREALNQPLTLADCQYAINTIQKRVVEAFEKIQKEQPQQVIPASQAVRSMQTAIDIATEYMTRGFTVEYTQPKGSQSEGSLLNGLEDFWSLLDEADPELKGKMGKTLGKLFDMLNEKLGIL